MIGTVSEGVAGGSGRIRPPKPPVHRRIDVKLGFRCNNHCLFCVAGDKRELMDARRVDDVRRILIECAEEFDEVLFTGGEPTLQKALPDLAALARELGYRTIHIQTNGRLFAYAKFCETLIKAGANLFSPAVHGHTAALHDFLTASQGSFSQTVKGIITLKKLGQKVIANTVVTKPNFRNLPQIAELLVRIGVDQFQFAFVHILGSAAQNFSSIVPRKSVIMPYVHEGLRVGLEAGVPAFTEAIPYCFMPGLESCIAERVIPNTRIFDLSNVVDEFTTVRRTECKSKGPSCGACVYDSVCEGPWREYTDHFGWSEFLPCRSHADRLAVG